MHLPERNRPPQGRKKGAARQDDHYRLVYRGRDGTVVREAIVEVKGARGDDWPDERRFKLQDQWQVSAPSESCLWIHLFETLSDSFRLTTRELYEPSLKRKLFLTRLMPHKSFDVKPNRWLERRFAFWIEVRPVSEGDSAPLAAFSIAVKTLVETQSRIEKKPRHETDSEIWKAPASLLRQRLDEALLPYLRRTGR